MALATDVWVPNVLTPNNDKLNDKPQIKGLTDNLWALSIYTRWGRQVYSTPSYQQDWDAAGLPAGLYYYRLRHATGARSTRGG